jgi:hypothetical protein
MPPAHRVKEQQIIGCGKGIKKSTNTHGVEKEWFRDYNEKGKKV